MKLEFMMLADKAEGINGKLYLLGGGLDTVRMMTFPALASYDIVMSTKFTRDEAGGHRFAVTLQDEAGKILIGPFSSELTALEPSVGPESRIMLVVNGPFPAIAPGTFRWRLTVDDLDIGSVPVIYVSAGISPDQIEAMKIGGFNFPQGQPSPSGSTAPPKGKAVKTKRRP